MLLVSALRRASVLCCMLLCWRFRVLCRITQFASAICQLLAIVILFLKRSCQAIADFCSVFSFPDAWLKFGNYCFDDVFLKA